MSTFISSILTHYYSILVSYLSYQTTSRLLTENLYVFYYLVLFILLTTILV